MKLVMKLVGGDSGRYEREEFVEEVLLARRSAPWSTSCSRGRGGMMFSFTVDRDPEEAR